MAVPRRVIVSVSALTLPNSASPPFVSGDYVYFQGIDDTLWRVYNDGTRGSIPGCHNKTKSSPFVMGDRIYFRGTNDQLLMTFE